jgi:hypothetical protein
VKARIRALGDFLALLAGARRDLMAREPGSRARHITMGGVVLSTGAFAALSMAFALHMAAGAPWPLAVALGLGWGVVIVNLDRLLIVGMRHDTSTRRTLLLAAPRVVLAVILGVVIATPLTLQIFRSEIDTKVTEIHLEQAAAVRADLDNDPRFTDIPVLQERIAANEQIQRTEGRSDPGLAPVYAEVAATQQIYDREQAKYLQLQAARIAEGDGSAGTGVAGHGPQWEEKAAAAEAQRQVAASALADLQVA